MKATVVDLRYKMKDVLEALDRNENVTILYHGKVKGTIHPNTNGRSTDMENHPFFGMNADSQNSVLEELEKLRGERFIAV